MSAVRVAETRAETLPENERDHQADEEIADSPGQKEQLYIDVLYTIANSVGAPAPGGQVISLFNSVSNVIYLFICFIFILSSLITKRKCTCMRNEYLVCHQNDIIVLCI